MAEEEEREDLQDLTAQFRKLTVRSFIAVVLIVGSRGLRGLLDRAMNVCAECWLWIGKMPRFQNPTTDSQPFIHFERTQTTSNHQNDPVHNDSTGNNLLNHPLRPLNTPNTMVNVPKNRNTFCKGKVRSKSNVLSVLETERSLRSAENTPSIK